RAPPSLLRLPDGLGCPRHHTLHPTCFITQGESPCHRSSCCLIGWLPEFALGMACSRWRLCAWRRPPAPPMASAPGRPPAPPHGRLYQSTRFSCPTDGC